MNRKIHLIYITMALISSFAFTKLTQADVSKAKIINIEAPLKNSISFNTFESLSSNEYGLIFNNDINDNNQLANKAAKLILAEVTGTEESKIKGVLGIKGQAANLIIANPNGISWADGSISNINSLSLIAGKLEKQYVKNKETKQLEAKALDEYSQLKFSVSPASQINISQQHASPLQLSKLNVFADRIKLQNALNITAAVQNYLSTSGSASISPREAVLHSGTKFKTDSPYSQGSQLELGENTKLLGRIISFESHQYQCKDSFLCPKNTIDIKGLIQTMNFSLRGDSDFVMHSTGKIQIGKNQQVLVAQ